MRADRFARGTTTFNCEVCGRGTRITHQPRDSQVCFQCYELAGLENSVFDNCADSGTARERDALLAEIVAHHGSETEVRASFRELFAYAPPPAGGG